MTEIDIYHSNKLCDHFMCRTVDDFIVTMIKSYAAIIKAIDNPHEHQTWKNSRLFSIDNTCMFRMGHDMYSDIICSPCAMMKRLINLENYSLGDKFCIECGKLVGQELMIQKQSSYNLLASEKVLTFDNSLRDQRLDFIINQEPRALVKINPVVLNLVIRRYTAQYLYKLRVAVPQIYGIFSCNSDVYSLENVASSLANTISSLDPKQVWEQVLLQWHLLHPLHFVFGAQSLDQCLVVAKEVDYRLDNTKFHFDFIWGFNPCHKSLISIKDKYCTEKHKNPMALDLSNFDTLMIHDTLLVKFNWELIKMVRYYQYTDYIALYRMVDIYRILVGLLLYRPIWDIVDSYLLSILFRSRDLAPMLEKIEKHSSNTLPASCFVDSLLEGCYLDIQIETLLKTEILKL